jgi:GNAT superfamily N-acetyltransferase
MRFTLRPASSDDAAATHGLLTELGYRICEQRLRAGLDFAARCDDATVIAVTDGEELIGLAAVTLATSTGRLAAIVVRSPRRRQGAGRILLAASEAVARARGCAWMEAHAAHPSGQRFLRSAGFNEGHGRLVKSLA